jgi:hypothetical protein
MLLSLRAVFGSLALLNKLNNVSITTTTTITTIFVSFRTVCLQITTYGTFASRRAGNDEHCEKYKNKPHMWPPIVLVSDKFMVAGIVFKSNALKL